MSQTKPLLADFEKSKFRIGCLEISSWCHHWQSDNGQYIDDGIGVESSVRYELAEAAALIRRMSRLLDAADYLTDPSREDERAIWYQARQEITGRPAPPEKSP